jgi:hypothetical protein
VLVQEEKLACATFPPSTDDVVRDELVLVQEGKVAFPGWDDVVRDDLVLVEEGKLA